MTPEEYKAAQRTLLGSDARTSGGRPVREWLSLIGISESSHKKYSSGAQPVSPVVERLILALLRIHEAAHHISETANRFRREEDA